MLLAASLVEFLLFLFSQSLRLIFDAVLLAASPIVFLCALRSRGLPRTHRSIFITGGSSGIGRALALDWAAPGITLFLVARSADRLADVQTACAARGAEVVVHCADVADAAAMAGVVAAADAHRPLDLIIANAGVSASSLVHVLHSRELQAVAKPMLDINVDGVWNTVLPAIPLFRQRRSGQIVIMSSVASYTPAPGSISYHATKMAVRGIGEGLRALLAPAGVRVNTLCPGLVESDMTLGETAAMPAPAAARILRDCIERNVGVINETHLSTFLLAWIVGALHPTARESVIAALTTRKDVEKQLGAAPQDR